jgi:subtilisin family serine protease
LSSHHHPRRLATRFTLAAALSALVVPVVASQSSSAAPRREAGEYIVRAKSAADLDGVKADLAKASVKVDSDLSEINTLSAHLDAATATKLASSSRVAGIAKSGVRKLIQPEGTTFNATPTLAKTKITFDPASSLPGLMWNLDRIEAPKANETTLGSSSVVVGVADTGLDYTHSELAKKVTSVVDFTDKTLCKDATGYSDADLSALFGGPESTDWNGHGSWIGGNIAASLDGVGINGIAPGVSLVALKISEWCGSAYDTAILDAFKYAADHGIDVVSISFGGYLDFSDPEQQVIYQAYADVVRYARSKGTLIVAAAGNEHVRVGAGGKVLSHGQLTIPGDPLDDLYGLYETPGGIPGVVMVSATGNVVKGASATCPPGTITGSATCKPASDTHQPVGVGREDQLTYYSNYGPRIDIAAPGGARKFNLPNADRGGTEGFPVTTADGYTAFEEFSITSNWALEIPCYTFGAGSGFYPGECYSSIQGTSMATPHVSAVAALIASSNPEARHHPATILDLLRDGARSAHNTTQPLSATDTSAGDRTGLACPTAYCHLGGQAIGDGEAYGAGIVDAFRSISRH